MLYVLPFASTAINSLQGCADGGRGGGSRLPISLKL